LGGSDRLGWETLRQTIGILIYLPWRCSLFQRLLDPLENTLVSCLAKCLLPLDVGTLPFVFSHKKSTQLFIGGRETVRWNTPVFPRFLWSSAVFDMLTTCQLKERNERERFRHIDEKSGARADCEFVSGFLPSISWTATETLVYSIAEKGLLTARAELLPPGGRPILR
jgi:hypothetical protein